MCQGPKSGYGAPFVENPDNGCYDWQRSKDKDGYGYFRAGRRVIRAHKFYYELKYGPVAPGMELDHRCRNRGCVNPEHLDPVPHVVNCRRGGVVKLMSMDKAREVRRLCGNGVRQRDAAAKFGISESLVAHIMTNRVWREAPASLPQRLSGAASRPRSYVAGGEA